MDMATLWTNRWFGFWREGEGGVAEYPSLLDWTEPGWTSRASMIGVGHYLDQCPIVWSTGPEPCIICQERLGNSLSYHTDGLWYWPGTLSHYVTRHGVRLPPELYLRIVQVQCQPPTHLWKDGDPRSFMNVLRALDVPPQERASIEAFIDQHQVNR